MVNKPECDGILAVEVFGLFHMKNKLGATQ